LDEALAENQYVICAMRSAPLLFNCSQGLNFNWDTLTCDYVSSIRSHSQGPVFYPFPPHTKPAPEPEEPRRPEIRIVSEDGIQRPIPRRKVLTVNRKMNPLDDLPFPFPIDMVPILRPIFDEDGLIPRPYPVDDASFPIPQDVPAPRPFPVEMVPILRPEQDPISKPVDKIHPF
jgi:hypothetical protein